MSYVETLGFIAGLIVSVSLFPQIWKSWKTKSTKDISTPWILSYASGLFLWVIYGTLIGSYPIAIMMGVEFLIATSLLVLKIQHK